MAVMSQPHWPVICILLALMIGCTARQRPGPPSRAPLPRAEAEALALDTANRESPAGFRFQVVDARRADGKWRIRLADRRQRMQARGNHCTVVVRDDRTVRLAPGE